LLLLPELPPAELLDSFPPPEVVAKGVAVGLDEVVAAACMITRGLPAGPAVVVITGDAEVSAEVDEITLFKSFPRMAAAALGVLELPAATVAPLCTTMTEGLLVAATTPRGVTVAPPVAKLLGCNVLVRGEAALNPPGRRVLVAKVTTPGDRRDAALRVTTRGAPVTVVGVAAVRSCGPDDETEVEDVEAAGTPAVATRTKLPPPEVPVAATM